MSTESLEPGAADGGLPVESASAGLSFAAASCQYPPGVLDLEPAYAAYRRLEVRLASANAPRFLMHLGDYVYVDATAGLFDPTRQGDRFETPYRRLRSHLERDLGRRYTRVIAMLEDGKASMLDDHEIDDDWEPGAVTDRDVQQTGIWKFLNHRRGRSLRRSDPPGSLWTAFVEDGIPFFVADTRTQREARSPSNIATANILGEQQTQDLKHWLQEQNSERPDAPKFIASPSILLPRHVEALGHPAQALRSDGWDGYPGSLHRLLAQIARERIRNVVFLSGDEHLSCLAGIELSASDGDKPVVAHSIHASALYAPYPFANSLPEDLVGDDDFTFADPDDPTMQYRCRVKTRFPLCGDGFAIVHVSDDGGGRRLEVKFWGAHNSVKYSFEAS